MLGHQVRGVLVSKHLLEVNPPATNCLLDPQGVRINVAHFAEPLAGANSDGGGGIGPYPQGHLETKIFEEGLVTESLSCSSHNPVELCFAAAQ